MGALIFKPSRTPLTSLIAATVLWTAAATASDKGIIFVGLTNSFPHPTRLTNIRPTARS